MQTTIFILIILYILYVTYIKIQYYKMYYNIHELIYLQVLTLIIE